MKLILTVDSIFHPLTGIGRYTWELARALAQVQPQAEDELRYFSHGRFVGNPTLAEPGQARPAHQSATLASRLRTQLAAIPPVVKLYSAVMPEVFRWRLKRYADHLFHATNFTLPPFDGPAVSTVHDLSTLLYPQFHPEARVAFMNTELPKTLQRATHLITPSQYIRQEVIDQLGWPSDKVTATHLGVDPRFRPQTADSLAPALAPYDLTPGRYCLCVATLEPRKNIAALIQAHAALPAELRLRYPLILAGSSGWNSEALHQQIRRASGPSLRYLDYVPQADLPALYAGARLFAFPSLYEGFGLPVIEAMASGVPVLTSRCSSLTEVAGNAAWLVNPLDTDQIRDGLSQALQDEPWRRQAVAAGLAQASGMTWADCVQKTRQVYERLSP